MIDATSNISRELKGTAESDTHEPTASDYRTAITNISSGQLRAGDCQVLRHMLRSDNSHTLTDALKLVDNISVRSSVQTKV